MKKVFEGILVFMLLLAGAVSISAVDVGPSFVDVPEEAYYYKAVQWAVESGITSGVDSTHFSPGTACSRAQAVTFLWRQAGKPDPSGARSPFADVAEQDYYYRAVLWATENDIVSGTEEGLFQPDTVCSRAQATALLWRASERPEPQGENAFPDVRPDVYYADAVVWAAEQSIVSGTGGGYFSPDAPCTRGEFVTLLYRTPPALVNGLELPINGATGFASVPMKLMQDAGSKLELCTLKPGEPFTILREDGDWWQVATASQTGWVEHRYCMINLPDVIPSILYDDTNSYSSQFVSLGKKVPGITGQALYNCQAYNPRFKKTEYVMPMLYAAAKHVCVAQQESLADGNCLYVYETFRPAATQKAVVDAVWQLAEQDEAVKRELTTPPWDMNYFISQTVSNHQRGVALDVGLVRIKALQMETTGNWRYRSVTDYEAYQMPTAIHELSPAAASTESPGSSMLSHTMNRPAIDLRLYFLRAGMSPLSSEWWHFNAFDALPEDNLCLGEFEITGCMSHEPS